MVLQTKQLTVAEFDQFVLMPENIDRDFEYIGGEIYEVVSNPLSSKTAARIIGFLFVYLSQNDIGHLTGADGGYIVSGERYIPDVGFISYMKQPELISVDGYNPNPPDLAVEVLSPTNDDEKMRIKIQNYQAAGTVVWVVDPIAQVIEVYKLGQPVMIVGMDGVLNGGDVLPDFKLAVKDIFPAAPDKE
jgi:Uma2 family endonuclease